MYFKKKISVSYGVDDTELLDFNANFFKSFLPTSSDCQKYQSEIENGGSENKPCLLQLQDILGIKMQVLFSLERTKSICSIGLLTAFLLPYGFYFMQQHETTILRSSFLPLIYFLLFFLSLGKKTHADSQSEIEFLLVFSSIPWRADFFISFGGCNRFLLSRAIRSSSTAQHTQEGYQTYKKIKEQTKKIQVN